jgi:hypothetical protein
MAKRIEGIADTIPSLDCPAAPFVDDFEDKVVTRLETLAEQRSPISESWLPCRDESQRNGTC